ncbi:MAG: PD40 domain-containing protein [Candidatus Solibacter usitatus]|nr:PD40 domain-containing protein [Candidatus Solibacter usitatus]
MRRLLEYLVERTLSGDLEFLKETNIGVEVFEREPGYDPKADAIVRVEAHRLRSKLEQFYADLQEERPVRLDLAKGSYALSFLWREAAAWPAVSPRRWPAGGGIRTLALLAGATAVLVVFAWGVSWIMNHVKPRAPMVRRLTHTGGMNVDPVWDPRGRFIIYASDRGGGGNLQLWRMDAASGEAVRITAGEYDDHEPSIAPQGAAVAYRSERDGGGIWRVPVEGGLPELIVRGGRRPKHSPDGAWLLYWVRDERFAPSTIHVVPAGGGQSRRLAEDFADAHNPVWSEDGKSILFCGTRISGNPAQEHDWWVLDFTSGKLRKSGAFEVFSRYAAFSGERIRTAGDQLGAPLDWHAGRLLFSASAGDADSLWELAIDSGGGIDGVPRRITLGSSVETSAAMQGGRTVFSSGHMTVDVWTVPIDHRTLRLSGNWMRATESAGIEAAPAVSPDSTMLAFTADRGGSRGVYLRKVSGGPESAVERWGRSQDSPVFSPDGRTVAYRAFEDRLMAIYAMPVSGGAARKLHADCGAPTSWSPDGKWILFEPGAFEPFVGVLNVETGEKKTLLARAGWGLRSARISRDGKWIAMQVDEGKSDRRIMAASFDPERQVPQDEWIDISAETHNDYLPAWSPSGGAIYFISEHSGYRSLWARRLDAKTKRPAARAVEIFQGRKATHTFFRNFRRGLDQIGLAVTDTAIYAAMDEYTSSLWLLGPPVR